MLEEVLDLDRGVEGDPRPALVQLARDPERVGRPVQEIGVPEADVARPHRDLLRHVGQHRFARHRDESASIDRDDGAVPAEVLASPGSVDRRDEALLAVPGKLRVPIEARQRSARGHGHVALAAFADRRRTSLFEGARQLDQLGGILAGDEVAMALAEVSGIERGVQPEERHARAGLARLLRHADAELQSGVHGNADQDQAGPRQRLRREPVDGDVLGGGSETCALQGADRGRGRHRLAAELVAGNDEDLALSAHASALGGGRLVVRRELRAFAEEELLGLIEEHLVRLL